MGSWMWRKVLKLRNQAKEFHRMVIGNGRNSSFWYDQWLDIGRLKDLLGDRGIIDLGIVNNATVETVLCNRRRRRHRVNLLNDIEDAIEQARSTVIAGQKDKAVWKRRADLYKASFSSKVTWNLIREHHIACPWSKGIWFRNNTPRYAFIVWIALQDKLATGDKILRWNSDADAGCVLCSGQTETIQHLFFECPFSQEIWSPLTRGLLQQRYTSDWHDLIHLIADCSLENTVLFLLRYAFQATVHSIWMERNSRRHGNDCKSAQQVLRLIDRTVRNRLLTMGVTGDNSLTAGLQVWFLSRI